MPHVKIDYVVSFSSEDPEHPASNLLLSDVKSKWLCRTGEPSCSLVLQLKSACKIDSITIGAYHVALLEVLVGLSERPNDPFQVLVPSCVLLSPGASRRADSVECVRTFGAAQLAGAAERRWDRVRLVCSQPYNKHCKYGLAFVHITSSDGQPATATAPVPAPAPAPAPAPLRTLQLDAEAGSSDDEFRPGELFARHQRAQLAQSTDAQIRQASSQALKNIPDASTKLTKTLITKTSNKDRPHNNDQRCDRRRDSLLYTGDDDKPHAKIDRVLQRQHELDKKQGATDATADKTKNNKPNDRSDKLNVSRSDTLNTSKVNDGDGDIDKNKTPQKGDSEKNASSTENAASQKKRKRSAETHAELGPACSSVREVLSGVVLAMSGYVNPERASLRAAALEMGAQYRRDWEPACTHLICAFPNTPKLRAVRARGAATVAVRADWLQHSRALRTRLPWRWFATEPDEREPMPPHIQRLLTAGDEDDDTDDEIERALARARKKQRRDTADARTRNSSADADADATMATDADATMATDADATMATDADATLATDADATIATDADATIATDADAIMATDAPPDEDATDEDERAPQPDSVDVTNELPHLWEGRTFVVSQQLGDRLAALLTRYIRAYGGLVLQEAEVLDDSSVHYVVGEGEGEGDGAADTFCAAARRVRPAWVWRQHRRKGRPAYA